MRIVLMYSLAPPSSQHVANLRTLARGHEVVVVDAESDARVATRNAEVILGHRFLRQCLADTTRLRWVQTSAQGVDRLPLEELAKRGVTLSRSTRDAETVATHAHAMAWSLTRALPAAIRNQAHELWSQDLPFGRMPRNALVMGAGSIGGALARQLQLQGIRVSCVRRRALRDTTEGYCEDILTGEEWRNRLSDVDWCFLALPLNSQTRAIFDESAMMALPKHAVVINVGRGETLDTSAALRVLNAGHLIGLGLDVVDAEPLPPGSPLWHHPRVLVTPHVASHHPDRNAAVETFFEEQLARYLSGAPLHDIVDLRALIAERD